jgi:hypothetical protein
MSYYKTSIDNHSLDNQELTSTITTGQSTNQTTTTESCNTVDNLQNPSKRKDFQVYKSEMHLYLQVVHWTLPHHTAQERQNQESWNYQSSHHHQYNAVALLLLRCNNRSYQWRQPAQQRLLSPLNPYRLAELSTPYLHQLAEEPPALAGLLLRNESKLDSSLPYDAAEGEEEIHLEAVEVVEEAEEAEEAEEVEECWLLCSPRPRPKQLSHKQLIFKPWGLPQEYSKGIEPKQTTSSTSCDIITMSTEGSPASTPP